MSSIKVHVGTPSLCLDGWTRTEISFHGFANLSTERDGFGDSSTFMGGLFIQLVLQGLCQGNGAAPACWTMLSSILIHCYKSAGYGVELIMPLTREILRVLGNMYVDDTNLYTMAQRLKTSEDVFTEMQAGLTCWSELLNSTGGAHKPEKCWWYPIHYECVDGEVLCLNSKYFIMGMHY